MLHVHPNDSPVSFYEEPFITVTVLFVRNRCLRCSQSGDGNAERGTGYIVQADAVAEFDGGRISAMLAADAQLNVRTGAASLFRRHADELSHAVLIQLGERIGLINLALIIINQEIARIFPGEAVGPLGQTVGSDRDELSLFGDPGA